MEMSEPFCNVFFKMTLNLFWTLNWPQSEPQSQRSLNITTLVRNLAPIFAFNSLRKYVFNLENHYFKAVSIGFIYHNEYHGSDPEFENRGLKGIRSRNPGHLTGIWKEFGTYVGPKSLKEIWSGIQYWFGLDLTKIRK